MARARVPETRYDVGGIALAGSLFLGLGIGMANDSAGAGLVIGLGVGLLLMALIAAGDMFRRPL